MQLLYVIRSHRPLGRILAETLRYLENVFLLGIIGRRRRRSHEPEKWCDCCPDRGNGGERFRGALRRHKAGVPHGTKFPAADAVASMTTSLCENSALDRYR